MPKRYRVTNRLYGTSKTIRAKDSTTAKRKAVQNVKSRAYTKEQLMKHLSAKRVSS